MEQKIKPIHLSKQGKAELEKAIQQLTEVCQTYELPMFVTIAVENNEETTRYIRNVLGASSHRWFLKEDQIRHHILIADGFHAVPPREDPTIDTSILFGLNNQKE